jgi:hypothetical protein
MGVSNLEMGHGFSASELICSRFNKYFEKIVKK